MPKRSLLACLLAGALLLLPACRGADVAGESSSSRQESAVNPNFPVTVGGAVIEDAPQSVVSLSPSLTELTCDLGYAKLLVGVSDYCTREDGELQGITRVGTVLNLDIGAVKRLAPDLLLTSAPLSQADDEALRALGVPVALLPRAQSVDALPELYAEVGRALGGAPVGEDIGRTLWDEQLQRLEDVRARVAALGDIPPEVCYLRALPLIMATGDTFEHDLLTSAGFRGSGEAYTGWAYPDEKKAELMPDLLVYDKSIDAAVFVENTVYNTTPAYKSGKLIPVDMDVVERQGVAMLRFLEELVSAAEMKTS